MSDVTRKPALILDVTLVTSVTPQITNSDLEEIHTWLFSIGEPEEDHHLVIDKYWNDPQALEYFLKHARGEFKHSYTVTDERR
ncbi:hypothetical protein [Nitrosomonas sp. Nm33]|uniref:hypothetical protein n=1 Tax=Nitrosomonas sp. Nm33 TaxID=133724 RepID=UPI00115FB8E8|nr:hypothetical protein [Nitrosomonas sp. Nm33]